MINIQGLFSPSTEIILASASPRRQALLTSLGLYFKVIPCNKKERAPLPQETPKDYAQAMASFKAKEVSAKNSQSLVMAADTIVVLENQILGKPKDKDHALEMLTSLNGKKHTVITGCCLQQNKNQLCFTVSSQVKMGTWDKSLLQSYIQSKEPMDKAGAYAVQGIGGFLIESINGSYTNVVGLPLAQTVQALIQLKAIEENK